MTKPTYEPRKHSVASMRAWEQRTDGAHERRRRIAARRIGDQLLVANGAELCGFGAKRNGMIIYGNDPNAQYQGQVSNQ